MRPPFTIVAIAALVVGASCGGDTTSPAKPVAATMSAWIDDVGWSAMSITIDSMPPSLLVVRGADATHTLALVIPLGQGAGLQIVGSTTPIAAVLAIGEQSWAASRTQGGAGSVTLTTVVPGHVVGTFEFTLAHEGASPSTQRVTSGGFDVKY